MWDEDEAQTRRTCRAHVRLQVWVLELLYLLRKDFREPFDKVPHGVILNPKPGL